MVLTYMGSPGVGKSTIARMVASLTRTPLLALGKVLRAYISPEEFLKSPGDSEAPECSALLVDRMIYHAVAEGGCIIDGYPRNENQLDWLLQQTRRVEIRWVIGPQRIEDRNEDDKKLAQIGKIDYRVLANLCEDRGINVQVVNNGLSMNHHALDGIEYVELGIEWLKMKRVHDQQLAACLETLGV